MNSVNRFELIITHTTILPSFTYVEDSLVFGQFYAMSKNQPSGPTVYLTLLRRGNQKKSKIEASQQQYVSSNQQVNDLSQQVNALSLMGQ